MDFVVGVKVVGTTLYTRKTSLRCQVDYVWGSLFVAIVEVAWRTHMEKPQSYLQCCALFLGSCWAPHF